jgi:hypothetical protein
MDLPIETGGSFHSYVSLPEGGYFSGISWILVHGYWDLVEILDPLKMVRFSERIII